MLENAVRICAAKFGNLWLREADTFRIGATHGAPPAYADLRRREPVIHFSPVNPVARIIATKQLQHIADYRTEQAYIERDPGRLPSLRRQVLAPFSSYRCSKRMK
jgi:hypothetical protein